MHLLISVLLATAQVTDSENLKKKPLETQVLEEEVVILENPDSEQPSQEIVIDDTFDDFYSDLEEEDE